MSKWSVMLFGSVLTFALMPGASASQYTSSYSDLDFEKCELVLEDSEFGFVQWKCAGAYGYDIYASEADLRLYLAFKPEGYVAPKPAPEPAPVENNDGEDDVGAGKNEEEDSAEGQFVEPVVDVEESEAEDIGQSIPPFNNLGPKLEWRAPNGRNAAPYATIVRYHYQVASDEGGFENGQVLVVSRFRNGHSCQVAYIDARANESANLMAREVADKYAHGGNCPDGAVPVLGRGGDIFRY